MHPCHELRATESILTALDVLDGDDALRVSTTSRSALVPDGSLTGRPSLGAVDFVHRLTLKIHCFSSLSYLSSKRHRRGRRMAWSSADTARCAERIGKVRFTRLVAIKTGQGMLAALLGRSARMRHA